MEARSLGSPPAILAHRGLLAGPDPDGENTRATLVRAVELGFDVEFDVNVDGGGLLTLAHDPAPWSEERDARTFLGDPGTGLHALNVKSLGAIDATLDAIDGAGTRGSFFLFDFELLGGTDTLMRSVQERGFAVAHRISDREPRLEELRDDPRVTHVWLDEWDTPWVTETVVRSLASAGKQTYYVSPDLHRALDPAELAPRWRELASWRVTGICTDYPIHLRELLGGAK